MKKGLTYKITLIAMAAVINIAGGQLALLLHLPIYLDAIGTLLIGALLGPWFGMLPGLISGILMGATVDIYSLYFMPVQLITGFMAGMIYYKKSIKVKKLWFGTLLVSAPGTLVSSIISAFLFGGVTSSGSSILVFALRKIGFNTVMSAFTVQIITDYADRLIGLFIAAAAIAVLPKDILERLKGTVKQHGSIQQSNK